MNPENQNNNSTPTTTFGDPNAVSNTSSIGQVGGFQN